MSKKSLVYSGVLFLVLFSSCAKEDVIQKITVRDNRVHLQHYDSIRSSYKLIYGNRSDDHWMNVYEPVGDDEFARPLIILAPGGGFDPEQIDHSFDLLLPIAEKFAHDGFVAAVINYSTGSRETGDQYREVFIEASHDLKAAIRFFRHDADHDNIFRIHPDWVFMGGWSAGAKIGLYNAYVRSEVELIDYERVAISALGELEGNSGYPGYSSEVRGIIAMAGNMIDLSRINQGDPPILCISSDIDNVVNIESQMSDFGIAYGSRPIIDRALSVGIEARLVEITNGFHTDPIKPSCTSCYGEMLSFLVSVLSQ